MRRTPLFRLNVAECVAIFMEASRLADLASRPPRVMPPIVPGVIHRLAADPRDPHGVDELHRRLFG